MAARMRIKDLQAYLRISRATLMRWLQKGMPSQKVGGVRLFVLADVEKWIASQAKQKRRGRR